MLSTRAAALEARLGRFRAFGGLRRALRVAEEADAIVAAAQRFAVDVLGCAFFSLYCTEKEEADFELLSPTAADFSPPKTIERPSPLATELAAASSVRDAALLDGYAPSAAGSDSGPDAETVAFALRSSPNELIGIVIVTGVALDLELLDEFVFDVESALSAHLVTSLRAEELAVLEIQERELVGLLRDVEARDAIIQRDLEEARDFQRKMLGAPPRVNGASIEVVYLPLGVVGGDLYAVSVDGGILRLFIADATGHGVRASLTTMFIKSGYEAVRGNAPDPATLLALLNDAIARTYRSSEMLFSAACVDLDLRTGKLKSASAAHPPACLVRGGGTSFIEGGGAFLGLRPGMKFKNVEIELAPGDGIYLYTDGFVEARKHNLLFGDERFGASVLDAHVSDRLAGEAVVQAVADFLEGTPLDDDGTFVGVRYRGTEGAPDTSAVGATGRGGSDDGSKS